MFKNIHKVSSYCDESRIDFRIAKRRRNYRFKNKVLYITGLILSKTKLNKKYYHKSNYIININITYVWIKNSCNIKGTALSKFLGTNTASMIEAYRALYKYVKERKDVPVFEADNHVIVMDKKLDVVFPGLMKNYKNAFDVAEKALKIEDKKERRAFLNENINMEDDVLTYSSIIKHLSIYFTKQKIIPA